MLPLVKNKKQFPSLFEGLLGNDLLTNFFENKWSNSPSVNVYEGKENYKIELAAPGLNKKDFNIDLKDNVLTISSETKNENEEKEGNKVVFREFSYSSFSRSFSLPEGIDANKIKASHENGILTVTLPKKEEYKTHEPRQISVS